MEKTILTLALALGLSSAWAAKAWNMPITITQPDGTTITVFQHGDEHFSWYTSLNGTILNRIGNTFIPITESKEAFFAKAARIRKANTIKREPVQGSSQALFPHTGSPKALIILAEYQDKKFSLKNPKKSFNQYLNKMDGAPEDFGCYEHKNYGSVRQYFNEMSNGQYTPQFDIVGPVVLPNEMQYYGGTSAYGNDERTVDMVNDACELVKDSVDFSLYDSNNDGYVDLVYVIYAGYGQSMGAANNTVWPKATYVNSSKEYNGKKIYRAGVNNELLANETAFNGEARITGLGLFIHEFSHCLGLPDFYASRLTSATYDNQGMEDWSIMDNGIYKYNGWIPTSYTAWEREAMGWETIETLTEPQQLTMENIDYGGKAYRIRNSSYVDNHSNKDEYFIIQRIQNRGWNTRLGSAQNKLDGLMVYHVDYNATDFAISSNNVNNVVGHPKMGMVPADGKLTSSYRVSDQEITKDEYNLQLQGDLYGSSTLSAKATFEQSDEIPNSKWWKEGDEVKLYNIHIADNGMMYVDFNKEIATTGITTINKQTSSNTIFSINGTKVGNDFNLLPKGIYIINGKKVAK